MMTLGLLFQYASSDFFNATVHKNNHLSPYGNQKFNFGFEIKGFFVNTCKGMVFLFFPGGSVSTTPLMNDMVRRGELNSAYNTKILTATPFGHIKMCVFYFGGKNEQSRGQ